MKDVTAVHSETAVSVTLDQKLKGRICLFVKVKISEFRNSNPGELRPNTLPRDRRGSQQYWFFTSEQDRQNRLYREEWWHETFTQG